MGQLPNSLKENIHFDPELLNDIAIDMSFEYFYGAVFKTLAACTPNSRPSDYTRFPTYFGMQD
jgi:hypothetical protein